MVKTRVLTAALLLLVFLGALFYLPNLWWALFLLPGLAIAAWEWGALAGWKATMRIAYLVVMAVSCVVLWFYAEFDLAVYAIAMVFWLLVAPCWLAKGWRIRNTWALAVSGWIVLLPLWLVLVRLQAQPLLLLMLMAVLWVSDCAAMIAGKLWGKHKLAPVISPGKTWEGVAGAFIGVAVYDLALKASGGLAPPLTDWMSATVLFIVLTILGIEGDLLESWVKRTAGVKDSGTVLPGHGGILDRIDALTSSLPVAALLLLWMK